MAKYVRLDTLAYRESAGTPDARTIYYNYPTSGPSTMPFDGLRAVSMVERLGPPCGSTVLTAPSVSRGGSRRAETGP